MATAALCPLAVAPMRRSGPVTTSPPAKIPGTASNLDTIFRAYEGCIGSLANGQDHGITFNDFFGVGSKTWAETSFPIEHRGTNNSLQTRYMAMFPYYSLWTPGGVKDDAFTLGFLDFPLMGGHLFATFQADHVDFFFAKGSLANCGTSYINGYNELHQRLHFLLQ